MRDEREEKHGSNLHFHPSSLIPHPSPHSSSPVPHPSLRILIITYEYPPLGGGTGKAAMNTARELQRIGHEVAVLTSKFGDQVSEEIVKGIHIFRIPVLRRHLNYANAIEVLSFAASGLLHAGGLATKFRPTLVLSYLTIPSSIVAGGLRLRSGVPFITLLRGQDVPGHPETKRWMQTLARPLIRRLWRQSHRVIANSEGLADMARHSARDLKIDVVRNGVDMGLYTPLAPARPGSPETVRILYVGRLTRSKRLRELMTAVSLVRKRCSASIELSFAGFGPEQPVLENMAKDLGMVEQVQFLGRLDEADVVKTLQTSDIFVNLSEGEGLPNAVLEAMACGLPVVLSDIAPHRELIENGVEGILCDARSAETVSDALTKYAGSCKVRQEAGRLARKIVEEKFSWESATRRLIDLF